MLSALCQEKLIHKDGSLLSLEKFSLTVHDHELNRRDLWLHVCISAQPLCKEVLMLFYLIINY